MKRVPTKSFSRRRLAFALAGLLAASAAMSGVREDARADDAVRVVQQIQAIPESGIPDRLLDDARAIVVVPDTIKAGFFIGGRRGLGLMSIKTPDGTWSNPVFVKLAGASFGLQAGVQSADVILVFRSDRGLESIVNGKFTLGADASVAAGPIGRSAAAATDGEFKAEIWSWSRARGLFAGVALDGAVLSIDNGANSSAYGEGVTPRMEFDGPAMQPASTSLVRFRDSLEEASAGARRARAGKDANAAASNAASTGAPTNPGTSVQPIGSFNPATTTPLPDVPVQPTPATTSTSP
ncbi:MAG: lipid-binding SYLF domain-containing protein [Pseudomonadota bacterium]|nr:lipid-binding SYLF domain-containing protein [Pseudomonadota bacterium]